MAHDWLDAAEARGYLKVTAGTDAAGVVESCRVAAARVIERQRPEVGLELLDPAGTPADADRLAGELADLVLGGILLTARLYARKGSPQGVATFGELGASMILRTDPDIGMLCGIGRYGKPVAR